jgi:hypothetical protein
MVSGGKRGQGKVEGKVKAKAAESNTLIPYLGEMTA